MESFGQGGRRRFARAVVITALVGAAATTGTPSASAGAPGTHGAGEVRAVVTWREPTGPGRASAPMRLSGLRVLREFGAVGAALVTAPPATLRALAASPGVAGVSPDVAGRPSGKDFDDGEGVLAPRTLGTPAGSAGAGAGVTVAVVDTGVSDTPALDRASGRLVDAVDTSGLVDGDDIDETGPFRDAYGHGTFMASLVAGGKVAGSGKRGVGVAPGATVQVVKVADGRGETSLAAVLAGLNWVATHADTVDVASVSLAVDRPTEAYGIDPLTHAVALTRKAGVTVVVAAGNDPSQVGDPGFAPAALTVGAADTTSRRPSVAPFSGRASVAGVGKPDLVAAGVDVLGVMPENSVISRRYPRARQESGLFRGSGTSEATAITAGAAALFLQRHPDATPTQVKASLRAAADPVNEAGAGAGVLRLARRVASDGTGEEALDADEWLATRDAWGDAVWDDELWSIRSWSIRSWSIRSWSIRSWSIRSWSIRSWSIRSWSDSAWGDAAP